MPGSKGGAFAVRSAGSILFMGFPGTAGHAGFESALASWQVTLSFEKILVTKKI